MKLSILTACAVAVLVPSSSASGRVAAAPTVIVKVSTPAFSPNGDGSKDTLRASIDVDVPVNLLIEIVNARGDVAFTDEPGTSVSAGSASFRWNGRFGSTVRSPIALDGRYTLQVTATDPVTGLSAQAASRFVLDTKAPLMLWGHGGVSPSVLTQGRLRVRFRLYDATPVQVKVGLVDQSGRTLAPKRGRLLAPGRIDLRWPSTHGARLAASTYKLSLSGVDEAGNAGTSSAKSFLVVRAARPSVWARFDGVGRRIALTFDDCNSSSAWGSILDTLARAKVKATFFCPGKQVLAYPSLALRTVREGHVVGSHGWDHADFAGLSFSASLSRLDEDRDVWWRLARVTPTPYFRPPYGAYTRTTLAAAGRAGYGAVVLWDVDPRDWTQPGSSAIESRILSHVRPGSIVLMHVLPQTAMQLPWLIQALEGRGYIPLTLPELARVGTPTNGWWPPYSSVNSGA